MNAGIKLRDGTELTYSDGIWSSENVQLARIFNTLYTPDSLLDVFEYDPDPVGTIVRTAAAAWGAEIIQLPPNTRPENAIL